MTKFKMPLRSFLIGLFTLSMVAGPVLAEKPAHAGGGGHKQKSHQPKQHEKHDDYPPAGYRYVRVASDILMIAIGTGMVVDAIADLTGMP